MKHSNRSDAARAVAAVLLAVGLPTLTQAAPERSGLSRRNVLVGMFGDGGIAAFDADNGNFQGMPRGGQDATLELPQGLWALGFGNDATAGSSGTLFFATDFVIGGNLHGLFGSITPASRAKADSALQPTR